MCDAAFWIDYGDGMMGGVIDIRPCLAGSANFSDFVAIGIVLVGIDRTIVIDDRCEPTLGSVLIGTNRF